MYYMCSAEETPDLPVAACGNSHSVAHPCTDLVSFLVYGYLYSSCKGETFMILHEN